MTAARLSIGRSIRASGFSPRWMGKSSVTRRRPFASEMVHCIRCSGRWSISTHPSARFCTPGFVMSLFALYLRQDVPTRNNVVDALARQSVPVHGLSADHRGGLAACPTTRSRCAGIGAPERTRNAWSVAQEDRSRSAQQWPRTEGERILRAPNTRRSLRGAGASARTQLRARRRYRHRSLGHASICAICPTSCISATLHEARGGQSSSMAADCASARPVTVGAAWAALEALHPQARRAGAALLPLRRFATPQLCAATWRMARLSETRCPR